MKKIFPLSAAALATVIALTGCGTGETGQTPDIDHSTMGTEQSPEPSSGASAGPANADTSAEHNEADVMFAKMMIPHHTQAVQMSEIIVAKENIDPQVTELATQIKAAQGPEIETLTSWLKAWGEPVPVGDHDGMDGMMSEEMDGMMSKDQMQQLETAEGEEAARLFLDQMIEHHNGAVKMAQQQIQNGSNPDAIALAKGIVQAQKAEIEKMNELLETI